jgi:hypothetical protein
MVRRLELVLVAFFLATWIVDFLALVGVARLAGSLELGLYALYSVAAASGWVAGNIYVPRSAALPKDLRRRFFLVYFVGPLGLVYLLRAMASEATQLRAPFVPIWGIGVFTVFFLVPVVLKRTASPRRRLHIGDNDSQDGDPPVAP